jgi:predicted RNA-binding Zn-ribbon protein involved in translation (DUF1610 family)
MKCPDCGEEITEITVERTQTKTFKVDHEKKELTAVLSQDWDDANDYVYRCQNCDTLNVNEPLSKYELKEV